MFGIVFLAVISVLVSRCQEVQDADLRGNDDVPSNNYYCTRYLIFVTLCRRKKRMAVEYRLRAFFFLQKRLTKETR